MKDVVINQHKTGKSLHTTTYRIQNYVQNISLLQQT